MINSRQEICSDIVMNMFQVYFIYHSLLFQTETKCILSQSNESLRFYASGG